MFDRQFTGLCTITEQDEQYIIKVKGKDHPITGHECSEGDQMCSSTLSSTSALDGGGWSTPRPGRFTAGENPVRIVQEAGRERKISPPHGFDPWTVQPVASRYIDWAIPAP